MTETPELPVFGAGVDHRASIPFAVEYLDAQDGTVRQEQFVSYLDPGSGPIVTYLNASNVQDDTAKVRLAGQLIFRALVDTDGMSSRYKLPTGPDERWEEEERQRAERGEEPREWAPVLDWRYDTRFPHREQWSSARRFADLASSDRYKMPGKVLEELADWIVRRAVGRPTKTPAR